MNERFNLRVLNAKAHIREWSRRRTLIALASAALAMLLASPFTAQALQTATKTVSALPAAAAADPASTNATADATDSYGTKVMFDFNGDGKTTEADWNEYLTWMHNFRPFDFDLQSGDLGDSHNGGVQITGATQLLVNGQQGTLKTLDKNLDVNKMPTYYLNNIGQITPVKNQSPWGTCWAFASISALESAILKAQYPKAYNAEDHKEPVLTNLDDHGVDLSELSLAWKAYDLQSEGSQKGEGQVDVLPPDTTPDRLACGGWATMAQTLFGGWQALTTEKAQPYWPTGVAMNWDNRKNLRGFHDKWAMHTDANGKEVYEDAGARVNGTYYLPSPNILVPDKNDHLVWKGYNEDANTLIKQALVKHGGVQIGYGADTYRPGQKSKSDFINGEHWAQYCDATNVEITHAVTIVGWDDNFDPAKFKAGKNDVTNLKKGAWLVKNSWNSVDLLMKQFGLSKEEAQKQTKWGIVDKDGAHTGFFWLSYYDRSINTPSYFSVDLKQDGYDYDNNYSYDYLINQSQSPLVLRTADKGTLVSNIFTAKGDEALRAVSVQTAEPNSKTSISIYMLNNADALKDNDPTNDGEPVLTMNYTAKVPGLHTVKLPHALNLKKGQTFAVVQNVTGVNADKSINSYLNLETGMSQDAQWPDKNNAETKGRAMGYVWSTAVANPGETFVKLMTKDGYKWVTPAEIGKTLGENKYFEFGNALIKAFTVNDFAQDSHYQMVTSSNVKQGEEVLFASNAPLKSFVAVRIDGATIDSSNYSVEEGTTKVTLKAAFTKSLSAGKHTIEIVSTDGIAKATFTVTATDAVDTPNDNKTQTATQVVAKTSKPGKMPRTQDPTTIAPMVAMGAGAGLAAFGAVARRKKN